MRLLLKTWTTSGHKLCHSKRKRHIFFERTDRERDVREVPISGGTSTIKPVSPMARQRSLTADVYSAHTARRDSLDDDAVISASRNDGKKSPRRRTQSEGTPEIGIDVSWFTKAIKAAECGDLQTIKCIRREYGRLDLFSKVDYDRRSIIHLAVEGKNLDVVAFLVNECNVPLDMKDRWQQTPLSLAKKNKCIEIAKFLESCRRKRKLKETATDLSEKEIISYTLCDAAAKGDIDCLKDFHKNGHNLAQADYDGRTALHLACSESKREVVQYLLEVLPKQSALVVDRLGNSPLSDAERVNDQVIVDMLYKRCYAIPIDPSSTTNQSARLKVKIRERLLLAIRTEDEQKVKTMMTLSQSNGFAREILLSTEEQCIQWREAADMSQREIPSRHEKNIVATNCSRLIEEVCATKRRTYKILESILEVVQQFGDAPASDIMEGFIRNNKNKELRLFLDRTSADPNVTGEMGRKPLYTALEVGNKAAVKTLLACRAKLNEAATLYQYTPLIYLIRNPKLNGSVTAEILELLLSAGANPNLHDADHGLYPIHHAIQSSHMGGKITEMLRVLLRHRAAIDSQDRAGMTALQYAAGDATHRPNQKLSESERACIVNLLVDKGADLNHRSTNGNTALHYAVKCGYHRITQNLLDKGADPTLKNGSNYKADEFAPESSPLKKLFADASSCSVPTCEKSASKGMEHGESIAEEHADTAKVEVDPINRHCQKSELSPSQHRLRIGRGGTRVPEEHAEEISDSYNRVNHSYNRDGRSYSRGDHNEKCISHINNRGDHNNNRGTREPSEIPSSEMDVSFACEINEKPKQYGTGGRTPRLRKEAAQKVPGKVCEDEDPKVTIKIVPHLPRKYDQHHLKTAFGFIAERIGKHYKDLVRELNKDLDFLKVEALLDAIRYEYDREGLQEIIMQCLRRWRERLGNAASMEALHTALFCSNLPNLARAFQREFPIT